MLKSSSHPFLIRNNMKTICFIHYNQAQISKNLIIFHDVNLPI